MPRNRFIQDRIDDGSLVLYHDYRSGSLRDWSGNGNDGTFSGNIQWMGKCLWPVTGLVQVASSATLNTITAGSFVAMFSGSDTYKALSFGWLLHKGVVSTHIDITLQAFSSSTVAMYHPTSGYRTLVSGYGKTATELLGFNFTSGQTPTVYNNGLYTGALTGTILLTPEATVTQLWNYGAGNPCRFAVKAGLLFNRELTALEHAQLYDALKRLD